MKYFAAGVAMAALALTAPPLWAQSNLQIEVLSSLPELVTGGDALVRITGTETAPSVTVDGTDVSAAFTAHDGGWIGLVEGLKDGDNALVASAGGAQADVTLVNHGINDTLFAGPQQTPFLCENETHGLAPATDASCAAPTQVAYFYRNPADKKWLPLEVDGPRPAEIDQTTTSLGQTVPLIVRVEKGVINRAAYVIAMLHDPAAGSVATPTSNESGWNGRLIFSSRGSVGTGYHQGNFIGSLDAADGSYVAGENNNLHQSIIEAGYALAGGSLNVTGTTDNDVIQAETMAKIKEHFVEEFGPPVFTIGTGTSGASMSQHLVANAYPGLYDGIMPWRSYPDVMSFWQPLYDCQLLNTAFKASQLGWTDIQKTAVSGKKDFLYCVNNDHRVEGNIVPTDCAAVVLDAQTADPAFKDIRCTYADNSVNIFGIDPETGSARFPWDNVGVQYGLKALNEGIISFAQFVDINTLVGGHDLNGQIVPERSHANEDALRIAYETGRMQQADGGLGDIPMLDIRGYTDGTCTVGPCPPQDPTYVDVHDGYHTLTTRARLMAANGNFDNQVRIVVHEIGQRRADSPLSIISVKAVQTFDDWVTAVVGDTSDRPAAEKVAAHRPADFVDACYTSVDTRVTDMDVCARLFPIGADARLVAGAPRTNDILKCQLKPVDPSDYAVTPSAQQLAELQATFPEGVCDYTVAGVGQVPLAGTWAVYSGNGEVSYLRPND